MSIDVMHHDEDHDRIAAITGQPTGGWRRIAPCAAGERIPRSSGAKAKVPTRYRRVPKRANRCGTLRDRVSQAMQALWLCVASTHPTAMVRKRSPVRVRQRQRALRQQEHRRFLRLAGPRLYCLHVV
jgi:hypothetical protein